MVFSWRLTIAQQKPFYVEHCSATISATAKWKKAQVSTQQGVPESLHTTLVPWVFLCFLYSSSWWSVVQATLLPGSCRLHSCALPGYPSRWSCPNPRGPSGLSAGRGGTHRSGPWWCPVSPDKSESKNQMATFDDRGTLPNQKSYTSRHITKHVDIFWHLERSISSCLWQIVLETWNKTCQQSSQTHDGPPSSAVLLHGNGVGQLVECHRHTLALASRLSRHLH